MTRHLTVGVDGSPESRWAASWAADEAALRSLPLRLIYAEDRPVSVAMPVSSFETQERGSDRILTEVANDLRERHPGLDMTTGRLSARPPAALSAEASEADLLVLGSRGLSRITVLFNARLTWPRSVASSGRSSSCGRPSGRTTSHRPRTGPYRDLVVDVDAHQPCDALLAFAFDEAARRDCVPWIAHGWSLPW